MDDERLGREHGAFLASVLGGRVEPEDVEDHEARAATANEVTAALGRRERPLTPEDFAAFRANREPDDDHHDDELADTAASSDPDAIRAAFGSLRRQRRRAELAPDLPKEDPYAAPRISHR